MKSDAIFTAIEEIAATSSKNEKQALVAKYGKDEMFLNVLAAALNPLIPYGIAKRPEFTDGQKHAGAEFDSNTWAILAGLAKRELTGNAAIDAVRTEMIGLSANSAELFWRIIKKDLRAGFSESTVNKCFKGLIPEFPYMRCSLPKDAKFGEWDWAKGAPSQEKADGMFANVDHEISGLIRITSRQGSEFPIEKFTNLVNEMQARMNKGFQRHGELLVKRDGVVLARQIGNGIMNSILSGGDFAENEYPVFMIWDEIPLSSVQVKGKYEVGYIRRLADIHYQLRQDSPVKDSIKIIPTRIVKNLAEAYAHAAELMKQGKEGTIIKSPDAIWKDGTSKEQIKLKLEFEIDLEVVGIVDGKADGKNEGRAGSLNCKTSDGKLIVDVTVKNEDMRNRVDANPSDWVGRIIAVIANDIMPPSDSNSNYSLFLPRMVEADYRKDKTSADSLERVQAIKEAAIFGESILKEAA